MQNMRDLLRSSLAKSLEQLSPLDRLAAAWPVAAGHGIAERSAVGGLDGGVVVVTVADAAWQKQLRSTAAQLRGDLARISGVSLTDILFLLPSEVEPQRGTPADARTRLAGRRTERKRT